MALKSTVFKVALDIADVDRGYYESHALTLARHPSETDERMMLRLLVFGLHADERLAFGTGLSSDDEPDLWQRDLSGEIELWIDLGRPDPRRVRKACARARRVVVYCYGGGRASVWWSQVGAELERYDNLAVYNIPAEQSLALVELVDRGIRLQCNVQEGEIWLIRDERCVCVVPERWLVPSTYASRR